MHISMRGMDTLSVRQKLVLLIQAGLSETVIAAKTRIPQPTINRIKNGQEPRERYVRAIDTFFSANDPRAGLPSDGDSASSSAT